MKLKLIMILALTPLGAVAADKAPKQQQVIHLRFTANLDTSEIALIMQAREGAIRALQMRALIRLRRILDEQGVFGDDGADAG